ncbi:MAG: hypothetical protein M1814_003666 [Vezdaea aestivalis]|nr:MAG: hypothetical protein M1814_003666 [Vezdaea aestivalis]
MFISHHHPPSSGFPNLEESNATDSESSISSQASVVKKKRKDSLDESALFSGEEIDHLTTLSKKVLLGVEVKRYQQNIVVFLRMHRAVEGGMSIRATRHFDLLIRCMAPLHSLTYATPSLIALAARKIYPHRIRIVTPQKERSMQWGSDIEAVTTELSKASPQGIIEEVLDMVEAPL